MAYTVTVSTAPDPRAADQPAFRVVYRNRRHYNAARARVGNNPQALARALARALGGDYQEQ